MQSHHLIDWINTSPTGVKAPNNEFKAGYASAVEDDPLFTLDGKTPEFIAGFTQCLYEQELLAGNEDTDSFDY